MISGANDCPGEDEGGYCGDGAGAGLAEGASLSKEVTLECRPEWEQDVKL